MRTRVFAPLGMTATTFDFARALRGNHATGHGWDIDGHTAVATTEIHREIIPLRPAGGAWSNARELIKYVQLELDPLYPSSSTRLQLTGQVYRWCPGT